ATAPYVSPSVISVRTIQKRFDLVAIILRAETMQEGAAVANHFLAIFWPEIAGRKGPNSLISCSFRRFDGFQTGPRFALAADLRFAHAPLQCLNGLFPH